MKTSVINYSMSRQKGLRFDASFHLSDGLIARRQVESSPYGIFTIKDVSTNIFYGNRAKRIYVTKPEHGIPFLSSSDILRANLESVKLASKKYTPCIEQMTLQKGWILISRSGTIGNCAFTNAKHAQKLASEDVIRINPNNILKSGLVYAYLASQYGHSLLTQGTFGAVIQHIEPDFVASLPIPKFSEAFQKKVNDLIQESAKLREAAADFLNEAVQYFDNLYKINPATQKTFVLGLKDLKLGLAAYNNNLEVDEFIKEYSNNAYELSSKTSKIFAPPLFKHIYLNKDNGYPFMTGSELTQFNLRYYRWLSPRGVKNINDYVVKRGTLLLYKSGTTDGGILGNVFIVDNKLDGCCLSDHVIRIVFNDEEEAYWAFAFLRSKGAIRMLQRLATGTMIPFITPERVSHLLIPNPDDNYDHIVSLIAKYIDFNSKSKENENLAISLIEQEIESWNKK